MGELRRHFRNIWSVRVPRGLQEATLRLGPVVAELQQHMGRAPTVYEIAAQLGCSPEEVLEAIEAASAFRAASLDAPLGVDMPRASSRGANLPADPSEKAFEEIDAKTTVEKLLPLLSARNRRIVELRFYDHMPQSEIAELVGISQMHVSRLLRQAIAQMSGALRDEPDLADHHGTQ